MELLWFLIIGLLAGWIAGMVMKGGGYGLIGDLIVGVIGAFVGGFVFRLLNITAYGTIGTLVMATIGAINFIALVRMLKHA